MLVCVSFIPSFRIGATVVKRANILSDIITFRDEKIVPAADMNLLDTSFVEDYKPVPVQDIVDATGVTEPGSAPDDADFGDERSTELSIPVIDDPSIIQIKDYSPDGRMMAAFYHALAYESETRPVRIAVLGDSFIEADIITADMREQLQMLYGGNGVGFVPFSTPLSKYRGTVTHNHEGWINYNLIKRKSVPEEYKDWFFVSGMLSIPKENAHTEYKGVQFRRRIEKANTVSLYFVNRKSSVMDVAVNDSESCRYTPEPGMQVQRIVISQPDIAAVKVRVSDPEGFIGYGVVLEDSNGVSVHNFSVRSNSGLALLGTDYGINRQFGEYMSYDLVILQYGLNAMSADVTNYGYYEKQLVKIVNYIKQCFPGSAVVIMSVGDRSTMQNGTAVTMPAVKAMIRAQESAASDCGVGFWNTYEAMGGDNSMPKFVERQWAAKDYTHIGYPGGKYIAGQFVAYINAAVASIKEQDAAKEADRSSMTVPGLSQGTESLFPIDSSANTILLERSGGKYSFVNCADSTDTVRHRGTGGEQGADGACESESLQGGLDADPALEQDEGMPVVEGNELHDETAVVRTAQQAAHTGESAHKIGKLLVEPASESVQHETHATEPEEKTEEQASDAGEKTLDRTALQALYLKDGKLSCPGSEGGGDEAAAGHTVDTPKEINEGQTSGVTAKQLPQQALEGGKNECAPVNSNVVGDSASRAIRDSAHSAPESADMSNSTEM